MSQKEVKYDEDGIVILDDEPTESADYTTKQTSYEYKKEFDSDERGFGSSRPEFKVYELGRIGGIVGSLLSFLVILVIFLVGFILFKIIGFIVWYFLPVILVYIVWKLYLKK